MTNIQKLNLAFLSKLDRKDIMSSALNAKNFPYHRWYPMTPMFPVTLVKAYLSKIRPKLVLDPFVGIGTTLVESRQLPTHSIGIDVNPFMCLVSEVKTRSYDTEDIVSNSTKIIENTNHVKSPPIPQIKKYYDDVVLEELLRLKAGIMKISSPKLRKLFFVALAYVSVKCANIKMSPAPRFTNKNYSASHVVNTFNDYMKMVLEDCNGNGSIGETRVIEADSHDLYFIDEKFDFVITSPPYCNNLDYVRHTQLELYWTDIAKSWEDLTPIRKSCISSCEAMIYRNKDSDNVDEQVLRIAKKIKEKTDRALPQVVSQYFTGMYKHFSSLNSRLKPSGKAVYVIGDSWMKDVYIPTHEITARFAKMCGFKSVKISYLRNRRDPYRRKLGEYVITMSIN
jgi:DNA modification methylase